MGCKAVLFDLDGTLLDTLDDIASAANRALAQWGYPPHDRDAYRWFVGDGSAVLMTRALPASERSPANIDRLLTAFLEAYQDSWRIATRPYPGIRELLFALSEKGIPLGVVSNKPDRFARICMETFFSDIPFGPIFGLRNGTPKKPAPDGALAAAKALGIHPPGCWLVGDSPMDMACAIGAGMVPVGVKWGFRPEEELVQSGARVLLDHPLDLLSAPGFEGT